MTALRSLLFTLVVNVVAGSPLLPSRLRCVLLRASGIRLGRSVVSARCFFGGRDVIIGDRTFINVGVFFDGLGRITVGDDVHIAMETMLLTGSHVVGDGTRRAGALTASDLSVEDGVWIGARAVILPGVTVGAGAVIAAGAVVTASCEPHALYAGVPARLVRRFDDAKGIRSSREMY